MLRSRAMGDRKNFINFRVSDDLVASLDRFVREQRKLGVRLSRAQAARLLIEQALENDTAKAALSATLVEVQQAVNKVTGVLSDEMCGRLSALLDEQLSTD